MCKFPCPFCILSSEKACPSDKATWWKIEISKNKLLVWFSYLLSMQNSTSMSWDYDYLYGIPSLQLWREQRSNHCMCSRLGMLFTQNTEREREKKKSPISPKSDEFTFATFSNTASQWFHNSEDQEIKSLLCHFALIMQ